MFAVFPGAAVAKQLASKGVNVAINYSSNQDRALLTLDELSGSGHFVVKADVFDRRSLERMVTVGLQAQILGRFIGLNNFAMLQSTIAQMGDLDIVISNAGWTSFGEFNDLSG